MTVAVIVNAFHRYVVLSVSLYFLCVADVSIQHT